MIVLQDSDAHYLHLMREEMGTVELPELSAKALLNLFRGCGEGRFVN